MVLIDIEKAFDKVWVAGVTYKLIRAVFPEHLIISNIQYLGTICLIYICLISLNFSTPSLHFADNAVTYGIRFTHRQQTT